MYLIFNCLFCKELRDICRILYLLLKFKIISLIENYVGFGGIEK